MPMRATEIHTENRGVRPPGDASTRSPTIEAARSGVTTSDNIRSARRGSGMTHSRYVETFEKRAISALRTGNGADALGAHAKVSFGAAATLGRRIPEGRSDQGFLFEPFQRSVKRSRSRVAACAGGDLLSYCCAIGAIVEAEDGEENDLLELSQAGDGRHLNYSVGKKRAAVNRPVKRSTFSNVSSLTLFETACTTRQKATRHYGRRMGYPERMTSARSRKAVRMDSPAAAGFEPSAWIWVSGRGGGVHPHPATPDAEPRGRKASRSDSRPERSRGFRP